MNLCIALTILFAIAVATASQIKFKQYSNNIMTQKRISAIVMNRTNIMLKS